MRFKKEKYTDLILYILFKCTSKPNFGKTVLCSILYFIDFNYCQLHGHPMTNETYIKSKRGIKPLHFKEISQELISKNRLFFRKEPYYNRMIHKYYPTIIPDIKFTPEELEIIDYCIKNLSHNNATSITRYAIRNPPITVAGLDEEIDFAHVISKDSDCS